MKHKNISEGVLDVTDEEGWLAKSQLYNIAKDAGELHQLIGDTDQLEAWMQAKITKAADYMAAVKNYIEYNMVSSAEAVQVVEPEAVPMESIEEDQVTDETVKWPRKRHRPSPGKGKTPKLMMSKEEDEENALE